MAGLPRALDHLVSRLGRLPGIGRRSAERIALAVLAGEPDDAAQLGDALVQLHQQVGTCPTCGYFTDAGTCPVCSDPARDTAIICVVEDALDVLAFERAGGWRGVYHVLGGSLSPLKGVAPEDLRIAELQDRLREGDFTEVVIATSPSVEGDATGVYLSQVLAAEGLSITRIGRGVPMGGSLELTDAGTLRMALEGRRAV